MNIYIQHTHSMHQMWDSNLMNSVQYAICSNKHSTSVGKDSSSYAGHVIKIVGALLNFSKIGTIGIENHWLQLIVYCFNTFGCAVNSAMCGWNN